MPQTPVFRAAGSVSFTGNNVSTPATLTPGAPAGKTVGDILFLVCFSRSIVGTVATPTGWTLVTGFPKRSGTASGGSFYLFTRVADGTATDTPSPVWASLGSTGTTGDSCSAVILGYTNAASVTLDAGTIVVSDLSAQTTTSAITGMTTSSPNSLVLSLAAKILDFSGANSATYTERVDAATTSGTGHGLEYADEIQVAAGASGTNTVTWGTTTSARALGVTVAFLGAALAAVDAATISASTTPSSVETKQNVEAATISTATTPSGVDALYADAATITTSTSVSSVEAAHDYTDSATFTTITTPAVTTRLNLNIVAQDKGDFVAVITGVTTHLGDASNNTHIAQKYIPSTDLLLLNYQAVFEAKVGSPTDNLLCQLWVGDIVAGTAQLLATSDTVFAGSTLTLRNVVTFTFSNTMLYNGVTYYFVVFRDGAVDAVNYYVANLLATTGRWPYASGDGSTYTVNGSSNTQNYIVSYDQLSTLDPLDSVGYSEIGVYDLDFNLEADVGVSNPTIRVFGQVTNAVSFVAEKFIPQGNSDLIQVDAKFQKLSSPIDSLRCEIRTDASGSPSSTILGTTQTDALGSDLASTAGGAAVVSFPFAPLSLTIGTTYWAVFYRTGSASDTNRYGIRIVGSASRAYTTDAAMRFTAGAWAAETLPFVYGVHFSSPSNTPTTITTPSDSEIYTPAGGGTTYTDADTPTAITTPSSSDTADYIEANTVQSTTSVATTEIIQVIDANTGTTTTTVLSTETAQFVESAQIRTVSSVSSSDIFAYVDLNTVNTVSSVISSDILGAVDAATTQSTTTPSSAELHEIFDSATIATTTTPSSTELHEIPDSSSITGTTTVTTLDTAQYIDASTTVTTTKPTSTETAQYVDAATTTTTTTLSTTDVVVVIDASTTTTITVVVSSDVAAYVDAATLAGKTTVTSAELHEIPDSSSITGTTFVTTLDTAQYVDANTASVVTTPSADEQQSGATADTNTLKTTTSITYTETAQYVDASTATSTTSVSTTDAPIYGDSGTVPTTSTPTATDVVIYTDAATAPTTTTPSAVEVGAFTDSATLTSLTSLSYVDVPVYVDSGSLLTTTTPTSADVATFTDFNTATTLTSLSALETKTSGNADFATVTTLTYVITVREGIFLLIDLIPSPLLARWYHTTTLTSRYPVRVFQKWAAGLLTNRYNVNDYKKWVTSWIR